MGIVFFFWSVMGIVLLPGFRVAECRLWSQALRKIIVKKSTLLHVQINNCRSRKKRNHLYEYKVRSRLPSNLFSRFHCASSSWTGFSPSPWVSSRTKTRSLLTPPMALPPSCRILRWRWTSPGKQECQKHYHKTTKKEQQFLYNLNITHLLFLFFF